MKHYSKKELFSIPNIMGYFRLLMIPVFAAIYLNAETDRDYYIAAAVMGISSITDLFDGLIARKFNMITEFGKFLDPFADKMTQGVVLLCLSTRYPLILGLVALFAVKEGYMAVMGLIKLREGKKLDGAMWFGKVCTALLFVMMFVLILFPAISEVIANVLIAACGIAMAVSFVLYIPVFQKM
jgi:cardiolipin synthase